METSKTLSVFPCLTPDEFEYGARALVQSLDHGKASHTQDETVPWRVKNGIEGEVPYVVVERPLFPQDSGIQGSEASASWVKNVECEEEEVDEGHDEEVDITPSESFVWLSLRCS